jgi:hypothetical protein
MKDLTARLDDWSIVYVGAPIGAYVLIGKVSGHGRLKDGNVCSTSPVRFLAADFSHAFTSSEGRRYFLGNQSTLTLKGVCTLATTLAVFWLLPGETTLRLDVQPQEIGGRQLQCLDG